MSLNTLRRTTTQRIVKMLSGVMNRTFTLEGTHSTKVLTLDSRMGDFGSMHFVTVHDPSDDKAVCIQLTALDLAELYQEIRQTIEAAEKQMA